VRTTVSEIGPLLMARLLDLNATQEGVLNIVFKIADEQGLLLLDFKDLTSLLQWCGENAGQLTTQYGNVTKASVGTIQRALLVLEQQGGEHFFGEPALDLRDMLRRDSSNFGYINVLAADRLMQNPRLYATFLLWLLSELFQTMPEVGDLDRPKFVFFFDEAHLLFDDAPKALIDKIEQVVRLIRSKGIGVYFITQNPLDVPETVLGQLSNRVQHALRAFTPKDQKAVRTAAQTFRANDSFDATKAILELGVGEALVSFLDAQGVPHPVERIFVAPPQSRMGAITDAERNALASSSPVAGKYDQSVDRASAYEVLMGRAQAQPAPAEASGPRRRGQYGAPPPPPPPLDTPPPSSPWGRGAPPVEEPPPQSQPQPGQPRLRQSLPPEEQPEPRSRVPATRRTDSLGTSIAKSAARTATNVVVREATRAMIGGRGGGIAGQLLRGVLGSLMK
jgi:DNA helicase HerA-like ATPase